VFKKLLTLQTWLKRLPKQTRLISVTAIYAAGAGLVAVAFQQALNAVFRFGLQNLSLKSTPVFLASSFVLMIGGALIAGLLMAKVCPEASGSGVPQLKAAFWKNFGSVEIKVVWVKFLAAAIQIGTGSSLGREGPSVQMAGALASNLAGYAGEPKQRRRHGAATGAASGLAAAFNTPLAAVTFVLEELIGDLNSRLLGSILLAGMIGALVTHGILGSQPAFTLAPVGEPTLNVYLLVGVVAAAASLVGVYFQKFSLGLRQLNISSNRVPLWMRPALGALVCWALGVVVFSETHRLGVFALGYDDLSDALAGKLPWKIAALLLGAKFFGTIFCYGSGGCGGIFSPTLFFGAMTGIAIGGISQFVAPLSPDGMAILAVVGMSATLGAVVRAPVTSILIVFEMTHQFSLVPPLMLGALISQTVSRLMLKHNFYDALLEQDGHHLDRFVPPRDLQAWHKQPISALVNARPVLLESLEPATLREALKRHPYKMFPLVEDGKILGAVDRSAAEAAIQFRTKPSMDPVVICRPEDSVKQAERKMVEQGATMAVVIPENSQSITGILTLHDLVRAQLAASDRADEAG
jgi:CIC family chloride channel protein